MVISQCPLVLPLKAGRRQGRMLGAEESGVSYVFAGLHRDAVLTQCFHAPTVRPFQPALRLGFTAL